MNGLIFAAFIAVLFGGGAGAAVLTLWHKQKTEDYLDSKSGQEKISKQIYDITWPLIEKKQDKEICIIHHHNLDSRLESIDNKLDILIEKN